MKNVNIAEAWATAIRQIQVNTGRDPLKGGYVILIPVSESPEVDVQLAKTSYWRPGIKGATAAPTVEGSLLGWFFGIPVKTRFDLPPNYHVLVRIEEVKNYADVKRN